MRLPDEHYDAVVIGGGAYGIMLALEGAARGQRILLLERDDFGGATSFNHLRTIHGGLRYLQFLDFRRAIISNRQRLWWLRNFPDLIEPISCLMPLYGQGLRRPEAFHLAFVMARALGLHKDGEGRARRIGVLSSKEVRTLLPFCPEQGLDRGAIWQDAFMPRSHRVVAELLHWAESAGVVVRNRMEFISAARNPQGRWSIRVNDHQQDDHAQVTARWVINATAAAIDSVAERITGRCGEPILIPTLAWGLLIDRPPVSACSVAVTPLGKGRRTYFVHPYHGRILAGTGHAGLAAGASLPAAVPDAQVSATLSDLNEAMPGLNLQRDDVRYVFRGILPGVRTGSEDLLMHPRIVDHGRRDGANGAWSVLGVKFTEAPFVARRFWDGLLGANHAGLPPRPAPILVPSIEQARALSDAELSARISTLADREWCAGPADVVWRRTDLWMDEVLLGRTQALASSATVSADTLGYVSQ